MMLFALIGGLIGFLFFVYSLEATGMRHVLFRNNKISLTGLIKFIHTPFHKSFMWKYDYWRYNWFVMTLIGIMIGLMIGLTIDLANNKLFIHH